MFEIKILVLELFAIDGLAAGAVTVGKITALDHELLDNPVENGALVVQRLSGLGVAFLAGAEGTEILGGLWDDIVVELENNTAGLVFANFDVEEDTGPCLYIFPGS